MKYSIRDIRDLLLVTVIVALAGCFGGNSKDDGGDIPYYEPGPEFRRTRDAAKEADLPDSSAPAPNPPKE